jgi:general secretion pathway protein J
MRRPAAKGFTLAEVLVASTISAFVALVAVGALKTVSDSAQVVSRVGEVTSEVGFAARILSRDLTNLYRDAQPRSMRLVGASQGSDNAPTAFLRFWTVGRSPARSGQPEGDVYEVEYILRETAGPDEGAGEEMGGSVLLRRLWPNPDEDREPGGTLVPIAKNIDVFQMRFFDGEQWVTDWPEEMESIPRLVEVTLATLSRDGGTPVIETFMVNFPRLVSNSSGASAGQQGSNQQQPASTSTPGQPGGNGGGR